MLHNYFCIFMSINEFNTINVFLEGQFFKFSAETFTSYKLRPSVTEKLAYSHKKGKLRRWTVCSVFLFVFDSFLFYFVVTVEELTWQLNSKRV